MLSEEYIVGLVDGEGSFYVRLNTDPRRRNKVELKFSMKLLHHDKEILDKLQQFFGCGNVYIQRDKRKNHSLCYRYEVNNEKEIIAKIIPFFEKNNPKIQSRMRDFELFREIAKLSLEDNLEMDKIRNLKEQMHWGLA